MSTSNPPIVCSEAVGTVKSTQTTSIQNYNSMLFWWFKISSLMQTLLAETIFIIVSFEHPALSGGAELKRCFVECCLEKNESVFQAKGMENV